MMPSRRQLLKAAGAGMAWPLLPASIAHSGSGPAAFSVASRRLDLRHTWTTARNSSTFKDNVFVRIERNGVMGWGEAAPNVRYNESTERTMDAVRAAKGLFESGNWFHLVDLREGWQDLIVGQTCASAALDIALFDWVGRSLGTPLYRILGLDKAKAAVTTLSIGIDTPEVVRQKVRQAKDFPVLKIKVGQDSDEQMLSAVRAETDRPLRVDANEAWKDKDTAIRKIEWLRAQGVELIEQPLPASMVEETAWLRERLDIPIIADEAVKRASDIPRLAGAYDGINIKLMKSGGIQEAISMIHVARALGLKVMLGCMVESSVAISAAAHLSPLADYADLDGNLLISNDPFSGVGVKEGRLILSDQPGLGVAERA